MWELLLEIPGLLIEGLFWLFLGVQPESKRSPSAKRKLSNTKSKRKPSKVVKVVIKSTNGEKHGVLEDHTDE